MYFFPDAEIEAILSEDIPYGDLTSPDFDTRNGLNP